MKKSCEEIVEEKLRLIKRNLQEAIGDDVIKNCLLKNGTINLYWGTAPTGRPHVAYFFPMTKIADFLKADCIVTILIADLHAYLDNMKAPLTLLKKRTEYYEILIKLLLKSLKVPVDKLRFIHGTDFQLDDNYTKSVYQIIALTTIKAAKHAGCDVVKQNNDAVLSALVYPLLQTLDEEFLGVDVQFGGEDQRKIFMFAEKYLPLLNMAKRAHLMNPMIPGLAGGKMSASNEEGKIDLLDSKDTMINKLNKATIKEEAIAKNGLFAFLKYIGLPLKDQLNLNILKNYNCTEDIIQAFKNKKLKEKNIKDMVAAILWSLMSPLNEDFVSIGKGDLIREAYPVVNDEVVQLVEDSDNRQLTLEELAGLTKEFPKVLNSSIDIFPKIATQPTIMWSCRASGEPHIGYLIPIRKLANMSNQNWTVIILIEDIGAFLHSKHNSNRPSFHLLKQRSQLYMEMCRSAFELFGGKLNNLKLICGSEFQCSKSYALLMYQLFCKVKESECRNVMKLLGEDSEKIINLSTLIYPCISVLDQYHLGVTVRLFGEREHATELLAFDQQLTKMLSLHHKVPIYVSHKNIAALSGRGIMNCAKIDVRPIDLTCISICDDKDTIEMKIKKAFFNLDNLENNSTLDIIKEIIFPVLNGGPFCVERTEENGDDVFYSSSDEIITQLKSLRIHPVDIKDATSSYLVKSVVQQVCKLFAKEPHNLLSFAFPKEIKFNKTLQKTLNINLRVAVVSSIVFANTLYHLTLRCGLDTFVFKKKMFYGLTPNDYCIIAVTQSTIDKTTTAFGILTNGDGITFNLVKKSYVNVVTFREHEVVVPHLQEADINTMKNSIESNIAVKGKHLIWIPDESIANEIEFKYDTAVFTKAHLHLL